MADFIRNGYGQVEPNHLSAQKTGQIYAQLPADSSINQLENGQFVKYDYKAGKVDFSTDAAAGEWMMVFNEVHTYDERDRFYKDFVMAKVDYVDGVITPRVIKTNVGDIFTTNTLAPATSGDVSARRKDTVLIAEADRATNLALGAIYQVGTNGFLEYKATPTAGQPQFAVVKVYTLADGQEAIKFQRVA